MRPEQEKALSEILGFFEPEESSLVVAARGGQQDATSAQVRIDDFREHIKPTLDTPELALIATKFPALFPLIRSAMQSIDKHKSRYFKYADTPKAMNHAFLLYMLVLLAELRDASCSQNEQLRELETQKLTEFVKIMELFSVTKILCACQDFKNLVKQHQKPEVSVKSIKAWMRIWGCGVSEIEDGAEGPTVVSSAP